MMLLFHKYKQKQQDADGVIIGITWFENNCENSTIT